MNPSDRLKIIRQELGLKQNELADLIGFKRPYLSVLESGKKEITHRVLISLFEQFQVSSNYILHGIEPKYVSIGNNNNLPSNLPSTLPFNSLIQDRPILKEAENERVIKKAIKKGFDHLSKERELYQVQYNLLDGNFVLAMELAPYIYNEIQNNIDRVLLKIANNDIGEKDGFNEIRSIIGKFKHFSTRLSGLNNDLFELTLAVIWEYPKLYKDKIKGTHLDDPIFHSAYKDASISRNEFFRKYGLLDKG